MDENKKPSVIVLCHTILHNAFRSDSFNKADTGNFEFFKRWVRSKFIADFIIEMGSVTKDNEYFAFTSEKIFNNFSNQIERECKPQKVYRYIATLRTLIFCVPTPKINELDEAEGIIVIADKLVNSGNYEPFIVTDKERKKAIVETATGYYKKYTKKDKPTIPFNILNLEEAIIFLNGRYQDQFNTAKKNDPLYGTCL